MLAYEPQPRVGWFSRSVAFVTTPFKFLGISGWTDTGCLAEATGSPVRDAQHSTDGFWTIDVRLNDFRVGPPPTPHGALFEPSSYRFIRLEIEPGTRAHEVCSRTSIAAGAMLSFSGPVVVDTDGPFLEIHPDADFAVVKKTQVAREGASSARSAMCSTVTSAGGYAARIPGSSA